MMKNSKLSKLLVAGVSVAMLTSAFAPMAFAEETSITDAATNKTGKLDVSVAFYSTGLSNTVDRNNANWLKIEGKASDDTVWADKNGDPTVLENVDGITVNFDYSTTTYAVKNPEESISLNGILDWSEFQEEYEVLGWAFGKTWVTDATKFEKGNVDFSKLFVTYGGGANDTATFVDKSNWSTCLTVLVKEKIPTDTITVNVKGLDTTNGGGMNKKADITTKGEFVRANGYSVEINNTAATTLPTKCYLTDKIVLPSYQLANGYEWDTKKIVVEVQDNSGAYITDRVYNPGDTVNFSDLGVKSGQKVFITANVKAKTYVELTLDPTVYLLEKDAKGNDVRKASTKTAVGIDDNEARLLKTYASSSSDSNKLVYSEKSVVLPKVTVLKADGKTVDSDYTFVGWEVKNGDTNILAATGKVAANYRFEDGKFDASIFKADANKAGAADVTVVPVFTKKAAEVTYGDAETPYDYVVKYVDGVAQDIKVLWTDAYKAQTGKDWKGGLFVGGKSTTAKYYTTAKIGGKYVLDTSVNGAKEGYVFKDGVQDTTVTGILDGAYYTKGAIDVEAYGLKKIAGAAEDDKFFYLVSDGLYVDDYTGIWVDEDGSIYNLINGCTSDVPFTGIVEKDGWATSVKDSKVDDKANGFILYGETQYWFINGTCNLNETEAVREHTDGNFYYTVGAKIDFTFNGECNGHTFVNGVASK